MQELIAEVREAVAHLSDENGTPNEFGGYDYGYRLLYGPRVRLCVVDEKVCIYTFTKTGVQTGSVEFGGTPDAGDVASLVTSFIAQAKAL